MRNGEEGKRKKKKEEDFIKFMMIQSHFEKTKDEKEVVLYKRTYIYVSVKICFTQSNGTYSLF
jgi:hypothetical protein